MLHQSPVTELVWVTRMYRAVWLPNKIVVTAELPAPVATGLPQLSPSLETLTL